MSSLFVDSIDPSKELGEVSNCLEFLLVSFCKHFQFKPKQAAGLLTQGGKYLAYLVAKGLKGTHEPIVSWYQDVYTHTSVLVNLMAQEEASGSVNLILSSLKSGFVSKHLDTAVWCCRLYSRLATELQNNDLLPAAWDWFVSESGGLEGCLLACRRYGPEIKPQAVTVIAQFAKNHFLELFSLQLRRVLPELIEYFTVVNEFLPVLGDLKAAKQEILETGVVDYWIDLTLREANNERHNAPDTRLAALNLASDLWVKLPGFFEVADELANRVLIALKRGCRDRLSIMRIACLGKLFNVLETFSADRVPYAPVIYKALTFSLVENYADLAVREFILNNFALTFATEATIPVAILVEPLIKQLHVTPQITLNAAEAEFFSVLAQHPRLLIKNAVQVLDVLGRAYSEGLTRFAVAPFLMVAQRFSEAEPVREYLFRFVRYSNKLAHSIAAKREALSAEEVLQRNALLDLVKRLVEVSDAVLKERLKQEILKTSASIKRMNPESSFAMNSLLTVFGNPKTLLDTYEPRAELPKFEEHPPPQSFKSIQKRHVSLRPNSRALQDIENIKRHRLNVQLERQIKQEEAQQALIRKKRALKQQLQKRKIEAHAEVTYYWLSEEEQQAVNLLLKRYAKPLRILFKKYSNTGYQEKDLDVTLKSTVSVSEIYRLLKEQGVLTSVEEVTKLVKDYCHHHKKTVVRTNFHEFTEVLVQIALAVYSRPPASYSHAAVCLLALLHQFRKCSTISVQLFDEPDPGFGDRVVVQRLNELLAEDPDAEMPENYKRFQETEISVSYHIPSALKVPPSKAAALEALDSILHRAFGLHIIEPILTYSTVYRAKGVLPKAKVEASLETKNQLSSQFGLSQLGTTYHKATYKPALPAEMNVSPGLKYEMARQAGKYPTEVLTTCAQLLDDLLNSVSAGSSFVLTKTDKPKRYNRAMYLKDMQKHQIAIEERQKEHKRQLRKQVVEEQLRLNMPKRALIAREAVEKQKEEEARAARARKAKEQIRELEREERLIKLAEWKAKRESQRHRQREKITEERTKLEAEKRQRVNGFLRKERQRIDAALAKPKSIERLPSLPKNLPSTKSVEKPAKENKRWWSFLLPKKN